MWKVYENDDADDRQILIRKALKTHFTTHYRKMFNLCRNNFNRMSAFFSYKCVHPPLCNDKDFSNNLTSKCVIVYTWNVVIRNSLRHILRINIFLVIITTYSASQRLCFYYYSQWSFLIACWIQSMNINVFQIDLNNLYRLW